MFDYAPLTRRRTVDGECWIWTGAIRARGANGTGEPYGGIRYQGRVWLVHRLAYTLAVGPIPAGMMIDHSCRRTLCFRPEHLRPATARENAAGRDPVALHAQLDAARAARWAA